MNNNYALTAANAACSACHMPDFQSAVSPNHVQAAFPTTCQTCHTTTTWSGATFNHATTGFALTGAHVSAPCASCHVNNNYSLTAANAGVLSLPHAGFSERGQPQSRPGKFRNDLSNLPFNHKLERGFLQSRDDRLCSDRRAREHAVRVVSREQ